MFLTNKFVGNIVPAMNSKRQPSVNMIQDARRASAVLRPIRLQILEQLREPDSASGLARRLNLARQKVNYHLRELEKEGLIELLEERRKGNCVERVVRATARSYLISPEAFGALATNPDQVADRFSSSYLVAVAARAISDLAILRPLAQQADKQLATLTLNGEIRFATPSDQNAFAEELSNEVARLVAKYHNDESADGRAFQFFIGAYPAVSKDAGAKEEK